MMRSLIVTATAIALLTGMPAAQAGENDLGLKASGNAEGPGGTFKGRAETTGSGQSFGTAIESDSRAAANPNSNNHDTGRVDTPADVAVKPPSNAPERNPPAGTLR